MKNKRMVPLIGRPNHTEKFRLRLTFLGSCTLLAVHDLAECQVDPRRPHRRPLGDRMHPVVLRCACTHHPPCQLKTRRLALGLPTGLCKSAIVLRCVHANEQCNASGTCMCDCTSSSCCSQSADSRQAEINS